MKLKNLVSHGLNGIRLGITSVALLQFAVGAPIANAQTGDNNTASPIKHVIVIIGENRSFGNVIVTAGSTETPITCRGIPRLPAIRPR